MKDEDGMDLSSSLDPFANPYLLLTPGPLSTTKTVRRAMMRDWCTWDDEYRTIVREVRSRLLGVAGGEDVQREYTSVLMQGSGTFCVESAVGSIVPSGESVLVVSNGAYGVRIAEICGRAGRTFHHLEYAETEAPRAEDVRRELDRNPEISCVAVVHCETTTGILNPLEEIAAVVTRSGKLFIVDAMSSFGGIPIDFRELGIDALISSANKCIQGVPGFGFVIVKRDLIASCAGRSRSLSLDLHDQWRSFEDGQGKWRYTSPTHTVHAFLQALRELDAEGGAAGRYRRYAANQRILVEGMKEAGYECLLPAHLQSPIITAFRYPAGREIGFDHLYRGLKKRGFVIYPGKVSRAETFRIGSIGEVYPEDMARLTEAVAEVSGSKVPPISL